jgi:hypothetical protein
MRSTPHPTRLIALVLAAVLGLTACGDDGTPAPADHATSESPTATATPEPDDLDVDEAGREETDLDPSDLDDESPALLETEYAVEAVDFGEPGAVTAPGTPLSMGEPAWLNQTVRYGTDEVTGPAGLTVLDIRELDPSVFDSYDNAEDFADKTPYAILFQQQWLYDIPEDRDPQTLALFPMLEDGSDAEYVTAGGGLGFGRATNTCGLQLPEYDEETKTLVSCFIGLGTDLPVTTAVYNGEGYASFVVSPDNPYFAQPLVWD